VDDFLHREHIEVFHVAIGNELATGILKRYALDKIKDLRLLTSGFKTILKTWIPNMIILEPEELKQSLMEDVQGWLKEQKSAAAIFSSTPK